MKSHAAWAGNPSLTSRLGKFDSDQVAGATIPDRTGTCPMPRQVIPFGSLGSI